MLAQLLSLMLALAPQAAPRPTLFQSPQPVAEMRGKQAVVETSLGTFVIELLPDAAPNHVALFMKLARDGAYNKTIFHRVSPFAVVQGGDPLTRDPAKAADYGQGGFNQVAAEPNAEKHTEGAISTVADPSRPDSGGSQFFICVTEQPSLDGQYTVFGRVVDGLEVVQKISTADADVEGRPRSRIEITNVTLRDTPPEPFVDDTPAQLATYRAVVETTMGAMELQMLPEVAPETVRSFLRMAEAGVYDGILVHRVAANFVVQTGALAFREAPLTVRQQRLVHNLPPEFSETPNVPGIVSMAHGDDPGSGQTSFFICTGICRSLTGTFTAFAKVVSGMDVLSAIAGVPVDGEAPRTPIVMTRIRVTKPQP